MFFTQPIDGIVGVGTFINSPFLFQVNDGLMNFHLALALVLTTNVLRSQDVSFPGHVGEVGVVENIIVVGNGSAVGVRWMMNGKLPGASFGVKITVCSLIPSRMGIIISCLL